jgi:hypothetical protein
MSDINEETQHIESAERFLNVCIERLQRETKTSDRLFTQIAFDNAIKEFVIQEAQQNKIKLQEIERQIGVQP